HTPFGHAGETILSNILPGGFTHCEQSLRVVDRLEYEGKGLNLTFEVRDGISKHSKGKGDILSKNKGDMPSTLEGQIVRASDVIAYVNHDIDDAVRAGVIKNSDIPAELVEIFGKWHASRIDKMVEDVVRASLKTDLNRITMSKEVAEAVSELRQFLYERVYFNPSSSEELKKTEKIITDLYNYILDRPGDLVKSYPEEDSLERRVGDVIAGMTDLYALRLYEKIFFPRSWPVL
ncbi:deoxyguanosinetriphosphate triphosphohydrolase, partial [Acidobacteriota bacterium]